MSPTVLPGVPEHVFAGTQVQMRPLDEREKALIELMAAMPPSFLPPRLLAIAKAMRRKGLAIVSDDCWYPTADGLVRAGRTLH